MPCNICGHTMHRIETANLWCPRCGTLKNGQDISMPMIVKRCREFETKELFAPDWTITKSWKQLGIAESIHLPGDRS